MNLSYRNMPYELASAAVATIETGRAGQYLESRPQPFAIEFGDRFPI
jgi:hypothetical protein